VIKDPHEKAFAKEQQAVSRPADWMFLQPAILDHMHDAVIVTNLSGVVTGCNRAAFEMFGYTPEELIGSNVADLYPPEDADYLKNAIIPAIHTTGEFRGEVRNRSRSGDYLYIHLSIALLRDSDGTPVAMAGFSTNVTAQKLGNIAIRRSDEMEQKSQQLQQASSDMQLMMSAVLKAEDAIVITEAEPIDEPGPRILFVNEAFTRMTGYSAEEVIGRNPRMLLGPNSDPEANQRIHKALKAWQPVREQLINYHKDGTEFVVDLSIVPIANEAGWYTHWFSIQRDVTEQYHVRKQLERSAAHLAEVHRLANLGTWDITAGKVTWSEEIYRIFNRDPRLPPPGFTELLTLFQPDSAARLTAAITRAVEHGESYEIDLQIHMPHGKTRWIVARGQVAARTGGVVTALHGTIQDITERKQNEQRLFNAEHSLRLGMQVAQLALIEVDYATGLDHLTPEAARIFGLGDQAVSVPRETFPTTLHPADREAWQRLVRNSLDPAGEGWFEVDLRILHAAGPRWLRVRKQVYFEGEGAARRPVRAMVAAFDVTLSKTADQAVRESEKHFRDLAESLPQLVWVADGRGVKTYCNQRYFDYTGVSSSEQMGRSWQDFIHPEDRPAALNAWKRSQETGDPYLAEYRLRSHTGSYRRFLARAVPVRNEAGQIDRWLGSSTDIHDQKLAEDALRQTEKLAVVGRLASTLSHEINNPLESVTNLLYLLNANPSLDAEAREYLTTAEQQLARVSQIAVHALRFHRQSTHAAPVQISELLDSLLTLHRPQLEMRAIEVRRRYDNCPPLNCFAGDIRQAIANILGNAIDALAEQGVLRVRVHCSAAVTEGGAVRITIADSGHGISALNLQRVFDPFFSTKGASGTGLGLWIARGIVERHGGNLSLRSSDRPARTGTVVSLSLPYRPAKPNSPSP
jgi:PAS domain S-box-containing protein